MSAVELLAECDLFESDMKNLIAIEPSAGFAARVVGGVSARRRLYLPPLSFSRSLPAAACAVFVVCGALAAAGIIGEIGAPTANGGNPAFEAAIQPIEPMTSRLDISGIDFAGAGAGISDAIEYGPEPKIGIGDGVSTVISSASVYINVEDLRRSFDQAENIGYTVLYDWLSVDDNGGGSASITLAAADAGYDFAVRAVESLGELVTFNESRVNVTAEVNELNTRIAAKRNELSRLMALLAASNKVEDMLAVETRLSYLTGEIEDLTAQLRNYRESAETPTINVTLNGNPTIIIAAPTLAERVAAAFGGGVACVGDVFLGLAYIILPLLVICAGIVVTALVIRFARRRRL